MKITSSWKNNSTTRIKRLHWACKIVWTEAVRRMPSACLKTNYTIWKQQKTKSLKSFLPNKSIFAPLFPLFISFLWLTFDFGSSLRPHCLTPKMGRSRVLHAGVTAACWSPITLTLAVSWLGSCMHIPYQFLILDNFNIIYRNVCFLSKESVI